MDLVPKLSGWPGWRWLLWGAVVAGLLWWGGARLWPLLEDRQALERLIGRLGWLGPLALIGFNALQIVAAPIPGYVVQAVSGFLYGPWWGGLWGALGLLAGAMLAMWLARTLGRRWVNRWAGAKRLDHWEQLTHSRSTLLWLVLLAAPIGDLPYFLAGLAQVSYGKILLLTLAVRVPATFAVAAVGAGAVGLSWGQLAWITGGLVLLLLLVLRYQNDLLAWMDQTLHRRFTGSQAHQSRPPVIDPPPLPSQER
jgi:uncharacterized membrane protein YdjX (TVP38/TMEM64 family)